MKKLMIAASAALCAAVGFGIESSNTVGYQGNTMNATKFTMAAPTFLAIGASAQCTLANLRVTGYEAPVWDQDDEEYKGGCKGDFVLRLLNNDGTYAGVYYWVDDGEHAAGWYANNLGTAAIPGGVSSVVITSGRGAWIQGKGYNLVSNGEVNTAIAAFQTNASKFTAAGNCAPVNMTLDQFYVTGYSAPAWDQDDEEYKGGCKGDFVLRLLNNDGTYQGVYYWVDDGEHTAGWYANNLGTATIPGGASSVTLTAGRGVWTQGKGLTFNVPPPAGL